LFFALLLSISLGNPNLEILGLKKLFIEDALYEKKSKNLVYPLSAYWVQNPPMAEKVKENWFACYHFCQMCLFNNTTYQSFFL